VAALYALGALTQQQAQSFRLHVDEGCPVCQAELLKFERAVAGMGLAAHEAQAPDYILDLVMARADADNLRILLDVEKEGGARLDEILSLAGRPAARVVRLSGQGGALSGWGAVVWDAQENRLVAFGNFPQPPTGKVYQLWFLAPGGRIPAGFLKTDPTGRIFASMNLTGDTSGATGAAVTLEPDNGSQIPTMPFLAVGRAE